METVSSKIKAMEETIVNRLKKKIMADFENGIAIQREL